MNQKSYRIFGFFYLSIYILYMLAKINGKVLVFTDFHIGLAGNKESRLKICVAVIKQIVERLKRDNISTIIFGGDWHHSRTTLDSNALNISYRLVSALAKHARCILICGNHDIYLKNSTDINSINIFKDIPNVEIVSKADEVMMNSRHCILVPWLADLSSYKPATFDFMFGHFDISSKYLIASYAEEHSKKQSASTEMTIELNSDSLLTSDSDNSASNDMVGNFVDYAKPGGTIFAGHIHSHKEFITKGRSFIFVGSPYQQTMGDIGNDCGYYVIDDLGKYEFTKITQIPEHVKLYASKMTSPEFDFSIVKGNIIQRIYDIDISAEDEAKITQKINDMKPYEELLPDYQVKMTFGTTTSTEERNSIELLKKSKLEYIRSYVDNIDESALSENKIDRSKLFSVLEMYYNKII